MIDFATTHDENEKPVVYAYFTRENPSVIHSRDNPEIPDGYGFHDAIHLALLPYWVGPRLRESS